MNAHHQCARVNACLLCVLVSLILNAKEMQNAFLFFPFFFFFFFFSLLLCVFDTEFFLRQWSFRRKIYNFAEKKWCSGIKYENKEKENNSRHTMYSATSSIPSGGPPGGTHTQELWYSLRGTDVGLQSVLSADKCLCGACCVRISRYSFCTRLLDKSNP